MLQQFIEAHTCENPSATIPLAELFRRFKASLPESERGNWPRLRLVAEAARAGLELAIDANGQTFAAGRSFRPTTTVAVKNGRLIKQVKQVA